MSCYFSSLAKKFSEITTRRAGKENIRKMNDLKTSTTEPVCTLTPATSRRAMLEARLSILKKLVLRPGNENCFRHLK